MQAGLESALRRGDADEVRRRLQDGADVDGRDRYGQTPLMLASHAGHTALVELLIERGAGLDATAKHGLSALMLAVVGGHGEVARRLARAGADLGARGTGPPGFAGKTAHDLALERGMPELARELRPEGATW